MDKVRIGIIGCGGIANGKHMPALKKLPHVEMVAFCDIIIEKAEKAAKDFGVEGAQVYTYLCDVFRSLLRKLCSHIARPIWQRDCATRTKNIHKERRKRG